MSKKTTTTAATMTPEEKEGRINALRELLRRSESDAVKAYEGIISPSDYAATKLQRQAWQTELDALTTEPTLPALRYNHHL